MKKLLLLSLIGVSLNIASLSAYSDSGLPTRGCLTNKVREIKECFDDILDDLEGLQCGVPTEITADQFPYTISSPGYYCLTQDFVAPVGFAADAITIADTDNVFLDLNGHVVDLTNVQQPEEALPYLPLLIITSTRVAVTNGKLVQSKQQEVAMHPLTAGIAFNSAAVRFSHLVVEGANVGLSINRCNDGVVDQCAFIEQIPSRTTSLSTSLLIVSNSGCVVRDCTFADGLNRVDSSPLESITLSICNNCSIRNCTVTNYNDENVNGVIALSGNNLSVDNVQMHNVKLALGIVGNNIQVRNSSFEYAERGVSSVRFNDILLQNCQFKQIGQLESQNPGLLFLGLLDFGQERIIPASNLTIDQCEIVSTSTVAAAVQIGDFDNFPFIGDVPLPVNNTLIKNTVITGGLNGIEVNYESQNTVIDNCLVRDTVAADILVTGSANNTTIRNTLVQNSSNGIAAQEVDALTVDNCLLDEARLIFSSVDNFIINNSRVQNEIMQLQSVHNSTVSHSQVINNSLNYSGSNLMFDSCVVHSSNSSGFVGGGLNVTFNKCQAVNCASHGFEIRDNNCVVRNCVASGNGENGYLVESADSASCINCVSSNNGGDGIKLSDGLSPTDKAQIHRNRVFGNGGIGINDISAGTNRFVNNFANNNLGGNFFGVPDVVVSPAAPNFGQNVDN